MQAANDSLVALCEYSFDKQVRGEGGGNPSIQALQRVACPAELYAMTQIRRTDEPGSGGGGGTGATTPRTYPRRVADHVCNAGTRQRGSALQKIVRVECR